MRSFLVTSVCLASFATAVWAKTVEGPSRKFEPADLFGLELASDPQIRPDGRIIAYTRLTQDVMVDRARRSIWLVDVEHGAQSPLAAGAGAHDTPRWSPDGKRLAYVSTPEGEKPQLLVRWMDTGSTARLTTLLDA